MDTWLREAFKSRNGRSGGRSRGNAHLLADLRPQLMWHICIQLIGQRRRWLNGSLAAGIYSLWHFGRVYLSGHGMIRLAMLHVQALLNFVTLFMGFFALANL